MELSQLILGLSRPEAYPEPVGDIQVRQTHISVVFLAGRFAYKIKKPVNLGFLDFSTLQERRHYCEEEVRLNRRLAPAGYLGVVPIVNRDGYAVIQKSVGQVGDLTYDEGDIVERAVKMRRLPEEATLQ